MVLKKHVKLLRPNPKWTRDGWILMAVLCATGGSKKFVGLEWIIASADMMEHSIPSHEELKLSLSKLISHGVVEPKETKFRITKKLASSVAEAWSRRGGLSVGPDKGLWWLKQATIQVSRRPIFALTVNQYAEAVKGYLNLHQHLENSSK